MGQLLNLKLIFLYFIALWLFGKAGEVLGYLNNPSLATYIREAKDNTVLEIMLGGDEATAGSLMSLVIASGIGSLIGSVMGLAIAVFLCRKQGWHWANPVLAFVLVYLFDWLWMEDVKPVVNFLRMSGEITGGIWYYIINGVFSLLLATLFLYLATLLVKKKLLFRQMKV